VNRYRFTRDSDILERMRRADMPTDISQVSGREETLGLRQQDFVQNPADVYAVLWSAAGGFGDPLERDPAKVETDVANGDVTEKAALEIYGVVPGDARATERRRHELRARRIQGHASGKAKLEGKVSFLATENLAVYTNKHYGCAKCATDLGPVSHNYKAYCARNDLPIQASNPIVGDPARFIDPVPQFRQFCCPGCGLLIENEIAVADDPLLRDVEILSG
jgi:N-methylhydantoinase B